MGFQLSSNLPTGGGSQGEWLGSVLPTPTLLASARLLGINSKDSVNFAKVSLET